jgi:hypothetical protein
MCAVATNMPRPRLHRSKEMGQRAQPVRGACHTEAALGEGITHPWRASDRPKTLFTPHWDDGVVGQEWLEMLSNPNGSHSWTAATVWDAERLVQIEMADVSAKIAGPTEPNLSRKATRTTSSRGSQQ